MNNTVLLQVLKLADKELSRCTQDNEPISSIVAYELNRLLSQEESYLNTRRNATLFVNEYNSLAEDDSCTLVDDKNNMRCFVLFDNISSKSESIKKELRLLYFPEPTNDIVFGYAGLFESYGFY
ncbi:hypothetical protein ACSW8S_17000 (plasmid) [Clostridium perfringens]